jgi:hypothetical protein
MLSWAILYMAGPICLSAWIHRHEFRQFASAVKAGLELLGDVCLALPALAYWDRDVAGWFGRMPLLVLLALGSLALLLFGVAGIRTALADWRLPPRRRWLIAALGSGLPMLAALPEVWWGLIAMHVVPA